MESDRRRTCLITGANRGIGLGIARRLDARGDRLALAVRSAGGLQRLCDAMTSFTADDHVPIICDVAEPRQIEAMFAQADAALGPPDALVVNAGILSEEAAMEITASEWDRVFGVNVRGAVLCCREAARRMAGRGGAIVVVGSIAAERPAARRAGYCAAKAAVHAFAQCAALEWAPLGIRVNVVAPGPVDTDFINGAAEALNGREALAGLIPLGRIGTTEDVAAAVEYLLGDEAGFITGAVLRVDGGRLWS